MTLGTAFIIQNEQDIIKYSLWNPLQICDEIVIVDGGSTDDTARIVWETAEELGAKHKIKWFHNKFERLNIQRNFYLDKMESDFIMYNDSDEVFTLDNLKLIKEHTNNYDLILVRSWHFYIDFWHYAKGEGWNNSYLMPRCFRNLKGKLHYQDYEPKLGDHTLFIKDNPDIYFKKYWENKTRICDKNELVCYHYSYAMGQDHQKKKLKFFFEQDQPEIPKEKYEEEVARDTFFDVRFWNEGVNPNSEGIRKFEGTHPEIMKQHPLYNIHIIKEK